MVKEAIFPDDPLSKEHWQNSFGFVGSIFGLKLVTSPVKKSGNAAVDGKAINEVKNVNESTSKTDIGKTDEGIHKGMGKSQIDYLRNKYGRFTSEELNYRIYLRVETLKELD